MNVVYVTFRPGNGYKVIRVVFDDASEIAATAPEKPGCRVHVVARADELVYDLWNLPSVLWFSIDAVADHRIEYCEQRRIARGALRHVIAEWTIPALNGRYIPAWKTWAEEELAEAVREVHALHDSRPAPGTARDRRLDELVNQIVAYEAYHYPIDPPSPLAAIEYALERLGLGRDTLLSVLGNRDAVEALFARRARLSPATISWVHENLRIPLDILRQDYPVRDGVTETDLRFAAAFQGIRAVRRLSARQTSFLTRLLLENGGVLPPEKRYLMPNISTGHLEEMESAVSQVLRGKKRWPVGEPIPCYFTE